MARSNSATTLNLESLNRMLALEEAMLANPNLGANAVADDSGSFPSMESLRSPTTRTLMYILEHRNAHGMISAQFAMAEKEREATEDLAERADELLKEPLLASFGTTVKAMLRTVAEHRADGLLASPDRNNSRGTTTTHDAPRPLRNADDSATKGVTASTTTSNGGGTAAAAAVLQPLDEILSEELDETSPAQKRRATQKAVAITSQPNQRTAVIHGASLDDPDVQALASVCFVLPKNEAGTVIAQRGVPSSLLHHDEQPTHGSSSSSRETLELDAIHDSIVQLTPLANISSCRPPRVGGGDEPVGPTTTGSSRDTLLRLLAEQRLQFEAQAASRHQYEELLRGLQHWQDVRAEAFDAIVACSVPHTTVQDSDFEVYA